MTREQIIARFPRASESFIRQNCDSGSGAAPVAKPVVRNVPLAARNGKKSYPGRYAVRITSVRDHLLDTDNLCGKYETDFLRYSGVIPDDCPDQTTITTNQRKTADGESEHVIIEVTYLPP